MLLTAGLALVDDLLLHDLLLDFGELLAEVWASVGYHSKLWQARLAWVHQSVQDQLATTHIRAASSKHVFR